VPTQVCQRSLGERRGGGAQLRSHTRTHTHIPAFAQTASLMSLMCLHATPQTHVQALERQVQDLHAQLQHEEAVR